jgi:hypothetical protein
MGIRGKSRLAGILFGFCVYFLAPLGCGSKPAFDDMVVFTLVPSAEDVASESMNPYMASMKIVAASPDSQTKQVQVLSEDFYSARAPEISYDGRRMVFSGQQAEGETWQIWLMNFEDGSIVQVSDSETNCTDPAWLPDDRIVFSKQIETKAVKHHALFTMGSDGCCLRRITFHPHEDLHARVLKDGRILVSSQQVYPELGVHKYLAMRPDGTKAELFYLPQDGHALGRASENESGQVFFSESGQLRFVNFSRPLHSIQTVAYPSINHVHSLFMNTGDHLFISATQPQGSSIGLYMAIDGSEHEVQEIYKEVEFHAIEPVCTNPRMLPRSLPTRVNTDLETGYFVCMNANASTIVASVEPGISTQVQVQGIDGILGETVVAEDGSFYMELQADQAVRFQTLTASGKAIRGPSSWMWVRPNERRGCVGCHEDREITPANVVPKAIENPPVAIIKKGN